MKSYSLRTYIDFETKNVRFHVDNLMAGSSRISKTYDITGNEKKQKSLLKLLQSEHVKYSRFHGVSKGWCPVPEEYSEYLINVE